MKVITGCREPVRSTPTANSIVHGECCTFPGDYIIHMRVYSEGSQFHIQKHDHVHCKGNKCYFVNLCSGRIVMKPYDAPVRPVATGICVED